MTESKTQTVHEKIQALRAFIKQEKLNGFIIPRGDEFLGEYVPACAERLAWLTGFTGSAGTAVVLPDDAALVTDGRYTAQAAQQLDSQLYQVVDFEECTLGAWIKEKAAPEAKIGFDPRLHTEQQVAALTGELADKNIALVPVAKNLIDQIWKDRPAPPMGAVEVFPASIAGKNADEKRSMVSRTIAEKNGFGVILAKPESVAWLLNIRGRDVPHIPVALSHAVLYADGRIEWFIDPAKISDEISDALAEDVAVKAPEELADALASLAKAAKQAGKPVYTDPARTPVWFKEQLQKGGANVKPMEDPCLMPRAMKTSAEIRAITTAHTRDGVAVSRFLKWADETLGQGGYTELDVIKKLRAFREEGENFRDDSFDTIAGWAENGAIIHYRATEESNKTITAPGLLLVDSGGQYCDGTTDITRTIAVGEPDEEMKEHYTLVLKGHIAVATALFPEGTIGAQIDALARKPLWEKDLDFDHGTGHGVGCYLSVHEEAASISRRGTVPFKPGMLISNEPGFYRQGEYGIRIENLVLVRVKGQRAHTGRQVKMLGFETITLAPYDRCLIATERLSPDEKAWVDAYHARVYDTLSPHMTPEENSWLKDATAPLA